MAIESPATATRLRIVTPAMADQRPMEINRDSACATPPPSSAGGGRQKEKAGAACRRGHAAARRRGQPLKYLLKVTTLRRQLSRQSFIDSKVPPGLRSRSYSPNRPPLEVR